jgi:predicted neuraminidase
LLDPGPGFPDQLREGFEELGIQQDMWADHAPRYTEMLVEAATEPIKRQTGWMTRVHPLRLPSGRILLPCYTDGFNVGIVAISDDEGATWRASGAMVGAGSIQPSLVRHQDGTLSAFLRDNGPPPKRVLVSHSTDEGETWSVARDITIPNPGSSVDVIALESGAWLFVGNDTEAERKQITAYLSDDEGATWGVGRVLESGEGAYHYPSVIQARDGRIHALFTHRDAEGASIRHMILTEAWVREGTLSAPESEG